MNEQMKKSTILVFIGAMSVIITVATTLFYIWQLALQWNIFSADSIHCTNAGCVPGETYVILPANIFWNDFSALLLMLCSWVFMVVCIYLNIRGPVTRTESDSQFIEETTNSLNELTKLIDELKIYKKFVKDNFYAHGEVFVDSKKGEDYYTDKEMCDLLKKEHEIDAKETKKDDKSN
jgi:predicted membrane protein